ncbi:MAG: PorT family protein [Sphingobacteriaceae bacterium]|nr:PorT family protein [Sphingobacteriaceae bacterium]
MKKAVMVLAILSSSGQLIAQIKETLEFKKLQFGFNIGLNYSNVITNGNPSARSKNGGGFRLGLIMSEAINERVALSPKAELSFNDCSVIYSRNGNTECVYDVYRINIDLITHLLYRPKNTKYKYYLLAGPNVKIPLMDKESVTYLSDPNKYGNNPDFAIDLGFGLEKCMTYYVLAPELRYSIGLLNVNKDPSLHHVYFHNITLVLNFKG